MNKYLFILMTLIINLNLIQAQDTTKVELPVEKLIIGVDDDGNVLGLEKDYKTLKHKNRDGYEREVFRIISTQLSHEACFSNHISFYSINEKDVCVVNIEPSNEPVYVNDEGNTTFYVRTGNATYPLSVKETVDYLKTQKA